MAEDKKAFVIGIPVYKGVDLLDVAAPYELFNWMGLALQERDGPERDVHEYVQVYLIAENTALVTTRDGMQFIPHKTFAEVPQLDLLWIPGGNPPDLARQMKNQVMVEFLRTRGQNAQDATSVCEGALLLASTGLLNGYQATTHWAFIPCLKQFPKISVVEGYPRFVVDRNRVTGGGISSGLDEALKLITLISGEEIAKNVQLNTQYFPCPPISGTIPGLQKCPDAEVITAIQDIIKKNDKSVRPE